MQTEEASLDRRTWLRFVQILRNLSASPVGRRAMRLAGMLVVMLLGINVLNVINSYVGRDFMTAIENRRTSDFVTQAFLYVGVLAMTTVVAVLYRFAEETLGLVWREWLTRRLVDVYLEHPTYYRINDRLSTNGEVANPDQRIADDVRAFTTTTLSFVLMLLNGAFTVVAFSGVLWTISPLLLGVAVAYAATGSFLSFLLGRPLVGLNYRQSDREANFRSSLLHVRVNAESVAVLRREGRVKSRILHNLEELVANFHRIIAVNRNLGFFTTGYNYLVQIIPALVVAPLFIRGEVDFGVITQSAMAFAHLLGAFSLVVTQFQSISSFAAVIARLGSLVEGMDQARESSLGVKTVIGEPAALRYEGLTLNFPGDAHCLVENLTVEIPAGQRVLVVGPNETANVALFRATAGVWDSGRGQIVHPPLDLIMFLPERPYLSPGTLRELLLQPGREAEVSDAELYAVLERLNLKKTLERAGGLDIELDWDSQLSLGEQQSVAFAGLLLAKPRFAILDRLTSALDDEQVARFLELLTEHAIGYVSFGEPDESLTRYDAVLELAGNGPWTWKPVNPALSIPSASAPPHSA